MTPYLRADGWLMVPFREDGPEGAFLEGHRAYPPGSPEYLKWIKFAER